MRPRLLRWSPAITAWTSISARLRRRFQPSLRGASLKSLIAIADRIGLNPRAVKLPLDQLANLHLPAVLHWDMNHFVVLERVKGGKALDPQSRRPLEMVPACRVFAPFYRRRARAAPGRRFRARRQRERLRLSQFWRRMTGLKRALAQILVLSLVMQVFVLASPYYMQVAIDSALPALDIDLLTCSLWASACSR